MDTAAVPLYKGYRYPAEVIAHAVWLYHRFLLSYRELEELLLQRGITVSYETIRQWCATFGPLYAAACRAWSHGTSHREVGMSQLVAGPLGEPLLDPSV